MWNSIDCALFSAQEDPTAMLYLYDLCNVDKISIHDSKLPGQTTSLVTVEIPERRVPNLNEEYSG